jgi:hypothetical protein
MKTTALGAAVLALILGAPGLAAQQPTHQMPQRVQTMDSQRMGMMDSQGMRMMDSMDARLDSLVTKMNRASGNAKVTAMAQVINELVAQRRTMRTHMREIMESHGGMMGGNMRMKRDSGSASPAPRSEPEGADSSHAQQHPAK